MKETNKEFKTPKVKKKRNQQKTVLILFVRQAVAIIQPCTGMVEFSFLLGIVFTIQSINEINES